MLRNDKISVNMTAENVRVSVHQIPMPDLRLKKAVLYVKQTLTPEEQNQACENIGLGDMKPSPKKIYEDAKNGII